MTWGLVLQKARYLGSQKIQLPMQTGGFLVVTASSHCTYLNTTRHH